MVVATSEGEFEFLGTQPKSVAEAAEVDVGAAVGAHLYGLSVSVS